MFTLSFRFVPDPAKLTLQSSFVLSQSQNAMSLHSLSTTWALVNLVFLIQDFRKDDARRIVRTPASSSGATMTALPPATGNDSVPVDELGVPQLPGSMAVRPCAQLSSVHVHNSALYDADWQCFAG
jgi:hypothetical protein